MIRIVIMMILPKTTLPQANPFLADLPVSSQSLNIDYEPIHVRNSTFLSGLSQNIHRWFRLTPSFGPELVRAIIDELALSPKMHIHDPFSGAGTTAIESSLEAFPNSCVEVNPFLHFVNEVCLDWSLDASAASDMLTSLKREYDKSLKVSLADISSLGVNVPPIHNVYRWWREDVLRDVLCIKAAINKIDKEAYRKFFRLALAAVLVPDLTNVTLGRLQLHFVDKSKIQIDAWNVFHKHAEIMIADLAELNSRKIKSRSLLINGDSTDENTYRKLPLIDAVITSPPYPNRYSYVWNTRPHLYMFDFVLEAKTSSQIDRSTIGGTWGTATSELMKGIFLPRNRGVEAALNGLDQVIRAKDNLMANYVVHYFNRIDLHLEVLSRKLAKEAKLAYVVGNSWIKDEYVATDLIIGKIIEKNLGLRVNKIHRFRRRHSGVDLFESIVYAEK